ncbi:helix-turn-helix protein [Chryseobacterium sp. 52]|uniref:helix-turn-helix domain-containing protein n=1 Tax=Chryseobacterium sp. 52 TaxID=2035213 RepID=UPI000C17FF3A|nr:helix-turn-helix domain-containing protein [Chryseobacterium sp. 52]PIF45337.1 helix-turn-helix protein [Chryseobacterium sp. 52]
MTTLGTKLARMRRQKGFSQHEIAAELKVTQPAYHKWETDASMPTNENIAKICDFFEISIHDLLDDPTYMISHNTFGGSNIVNQNIETISNMHINSPELIKSLIDNQKEMAKLIEMQGKLIDKLIDK